MRQAVANGEVSIHHVNGDEHQLADLGTKNVPALEAEQKLAVLKATPPSAAFLGEQRGVLEIKALPGSERERNPRKHHEGAESYGQVPAVTAKRETHSRQRKERGNCRGRHSG